MSNQNGEICRADPTGQGFDLCYFTASASAARTPAA